MGEREESPLSSDWPLTRPVSDHPAAVTLLGELHGNLWASLRHTLDLDKVTLTALWLANLGGMILTAVAGKHPIPQAATITALGVVDVLIYRIFRNSRTEAQRIISLLTGAVSAVATLANSSAAYQT